MSIAPIAPHPTEHREAYRGIVDDLIHLGHQLAREIHALATGPTKSLPAAEAAIAFERVARTVRRTILLAEKLAKAPAAAAAEPQMHRAFARRRILREVEDTIQRTARGDRADSLHTELLDRLDGPDIEYDLGNRPIGEIIADIVRDLGLVRMPGAHPWKRRTPADIATLIVRASAEIPSVPGSTRQSAASTEPQPTAAEADPATSFAPDPETATPDPQVTAPGSALLRFTPPKHR